MNKLTILVTCYNCEKYLAKCIESIKSQINEKYICYILNDMSTDSSAQVALETIGSDSRFILVNNSRKLYQVGNYENIVKGPYEVNDEDILVELDGDDYFYNESVLTLISEIYSKTLCLMTHGSFVFCDDMSTTNYREDINRRFNHPIITIESLRSEKMFIMHLRTWKAKLQRLIPDSYHKDILGNYYSTGGDFNLFVSMAELAGIDKIAFVRVPLVVYNVENPINDFKLDPIKQKHFQAQQAARPSLARNH